MSSDNLSRLLIGLKNAGVETGERNKTVADKTGYALGTITRILSGNAALTDRFIQSVCSAFAIRKQWICEGEEPIIKAQGVDIAEFEGLHMSPKWHKERFSKLESFRKLLDDLETMKSEITTELEEEKVFFISDTERYKDLIMEFKKIPADERNRARDVLFRVQALMAEEVDQPTKD